MKVTADDCRSCGACCAGNVTAMAWADCTSADVARMSKRVRLQLIPTTVGMINTDKWYATPTVETPSGGFACAYLRGTVGKRVSCRIYETRPRVCSSFRPGSRACIEARKEMGL